MYRKKNAAEKAQDAANMAQAAIKEHQAVREIIAEASEWGPSGFARVSLMCFANMEDASSSYCTAVDQAEETHVADIPGIAGKWDHTTHIGTYTD